MKFTANKKGLSALVLALVLALSLAACGGSNAYDDVLNEYEKFVTSVEDMANKGGEFTAEKQQELTKGAQDFASKVQNVTTKTQPTEAQIKRMNDLSTRYATALQKLAQSNIPSMGGE